MSISYTLVPMPKWVLMDDFGRPAGGGFLAAYDNLDKSLPKAVFSDASGLAAWLIQAIPNTGLFGIPFDENGTQGPFFWAFDDSNPQDAYFLSAFDANGNLLWTIDNFGPGVAGGGGGGSIITINQNLQNYIINNAFYHNASLNDGVAIATGTLVTLAPSAHAGLVNNGATPNDTTIVNPAPDIVFIKSGAGSTDSLKFKKFTLGSNDLTGGVTPVWYLNYASDAGPEIKKAIQIPITQGVQNLSNQDVTIGLWARNNGGNTNISVQLVQFFGDPSASSSPPVFGPLTTLTTTTSWQFFPVQTTVPNASTKTIGGCHNDGLFLHINYATSAVVDIDITKPALYLGTFTNIIPDFYTNDMAEAIVNDFRTGDIRMSMNTFAPFGWVPMNDGTIGAVGSGATTRASEDTYPLYATLWNNVADLYAPVSTGRGASAQVDFAAGKTLRLTKALGRVLAGIGAPTLNDDPPITGGSNTLTAWALGENTGYELHTQQPTELAAHVHTGTLIQHGSAVGGGGGTNFRLDGADGATPIATAFTTDPTGSSTPMNIINPVMHTNVFIKL